jgi:polyisoprenoid-binding protein YceI
VTADVQASAGAAAAVLGGEKAVRSVELRIPAARLDCRNGTMNEHMYKAIRAAEHGEIVFKLASYDVSAADGAVRGTLAGTLTLGGVTRTIAVEASGAGAGPNALRVTGTHQLKLSDFGLKAPSLMMGTMKGRRRRHRRVRPRAQGRADRRRHQLTDLTSPRTPPCAPTPASPSSAPSR